MEHGRGDSGLRHAMSKYFPEICGKRENSTKKKILDWYRNRGAIAAKASNPTEATILTTRQVGQATVLGSVAENRIVDWILSHRQDGIPICNLLLQQFALQVAVDENLQPHQFKASSNWIESFKRRHSLSMRTQTRCGNKSQEDGDQSLKNFSARIVKLISGNDISEIYNADQTAVNYEFLGK
ncbi:hypothetical protein AeMF1_021247 [Aphanomyces euteiches]|nr:hypothetical protein AeMF1_021247 [Aphanomyces euteiches]